jgi:hypothetical protein
MLAPQWLSTGSAEDASAVEEAGGREELVRRSSLIRVKIRPIELPMRGA